MLFFECPSPLRFLTGNVPFASWKDGPDGLLESDEGAASVVVLGDASRGALYLALRPAASNGESPSPPPPERRAPSDFLEGLARLYSSPGCRARSGGGIVAGWRNVVLRGL